jgi:hypothetical protein
MPYSPWINYTGGESLARGIIAGSEGYSRGIESAAQSISGTMNKMTDENRKEEEKAKATKEELDFLSGMKEHLASENALTADELAKFDTGGIGVKRAIVSGGGTKLAALEREKMTELAHPQKPDFKPSGQMISIDDGKGGTIQVPIVNTSRGSAQVINANELKAKEYMSGYSGEQPLELNVNGVKMLVDPKTHKPYTNSMNLSDKQLAPHVDRLPFIKLDASRENLKGIRDILKDPTLSAEDRADYESKLTIAQEALNKAAVDSGVLTQDQLDRAGDDRERRIEVARLDHEASELEKIGEPKKGLFSNSGRTPEQEARFQEITKQKELLSKPLTKKTDEGGPATVGVSEASQYFQQLVKGGKSEADALAEVNKKFRRKGN